MKKLAFTLTATACVAALVALAVTRSRPTHDAIAVPSNTAEVVPATSTPTAPETALGKPDPVTLTAARPSAAEPQERALPSVRIAFEHEPRDASAAAAEAQIRGLYAAVPGTDGIVRSVRCTQNVCKIEARWSSAWSKPYNAVIVKLVDAFSREVTFEPAGPPEGLNVPVDIYIRRSEATTMQE
jgi:hypothetical protein